MPIPAILIGIAIGGAAGTVGGYLLRGREVAKLKKQVEILQRENKRLQRTILEQQRQINELKIRYKALRVWAYKEKLEYKGLLRGKLLFQYALYEYLRILKEKIDCTEISEEEREFFHAFDQIINNMVPETEKMTVMQHVKGYIYSKYSDKVNDAIPPSIDQHLRKLGVSDE